jgi:hypothetical protein
VKGVGVLVLWCCGAVDVNRFVAVQDLSVNTSYSRQISRLLLESGWRFIQDCREVLPKGDFSLAVMFLLALNLLPAIHFYSLRSDIARVYFF